MRPSASADQYQAFLQISLLIVDRRRLTDFDESLHTYRPECIVLIFRYTDQTPYNPIRQGYPLSEDGDKYAD